MYLGYFGLTERPFSIAPDPQYLYMSKRHKEAMAHLSYGLSQGGCFIVLTGEVGTGKTTLCRNLLGRLPDNVDVALILNANINEQELLQTVCDELKITYQEDDSQKQLLDKINMSLLTTFADNRQTVLIIDEAQLLSRDVLEQIRLLTNLETTKSKLLQIILIGQPELSDVLERNDLRQLAQRVTARYHLGALQRDEIQEYVNFRLSVAGCKQPLFSRQAVTQIHQLTDGIPRKINVLADHALLSAYANTQRVVDSKTIRQAARDVFINTRKKHQPSGFQLPNWWWAIPLVLLLNIGFWVWFAGGDSDGDQSSQVETETTTQQQESNESSQALVSVGSTESDSVVSKEFEVAAVDEPKIELMAKQSNTEDISTESISSENISSENISAESNVVVVNADENIVPGTVQVSKEFLDASELDQSPSQDVSQPEQPFIEGLGFDEQAPVSSGDEVDVATINPNVFGGLTESEYLQDTPFGRVLETSADLTGRIEVFKVLANQWRASLPRKLLKPACDVLLEQGIECLAFDAWSSFTRLNRPGIIVVNHKNQLHRVIVQSISNDVANVLVGEQYHEVPIPELLGRWTNRGVLFWRPSAVGEQFLEQGSEGPAVLAMRARLNGALTAVNLPILNSISNSLFDSDMRQKVFALQAKFGLNQDGQIGYETHFLINEILAPRTTVVLSAKRGSKPLKSTADGLEPLGGQ